MIFKEQHLNIWALKVDKTTFNTPIQELLIYSIGNFFEENPHKSISDLVEESDITSHPHLIYLQEKLGYFFRNQELLLQCLSHRSFIYRYPSLNLKNNERLEFLGDTILEFLISIYLYSNYPSLDEGGLSRFRGALINQESLAQLARFLKLSRCILLGKGEINREISVKDSILSDCFESLMGAVFLDSNIKTARAVLENVFLLWKKEHKGDFISESKLLSFDSKSKLQELVVAHYKKYPEYRSYSIDTKNFLVELWINDKLISKKISYSKKKAEKDLALEALEKKLYLTEGVRSILKK